MNEKNEKVTHDSKSLPTTPQLASLGFLSALRYRLPIRHPQVVNHAKRRDDPLSLWVTDLADRTHPNVVAVALANKTVRVAWVMLRHGTDYDPEFAVV